MTYPLRTNVRTFDDVRRALQVLAPFIPFPSTTVPNTAADESDGWKVGSKITVDGATVPAALKGIYQCFDNSIGAADWKKMVDVQNELPAGDPSGGSTPDPVVDNQVTRFDQTTGRIQGSSVFLDDVGNLTGTTNHDDICFIDQASPFVVGGVVTVTSAYTATTADTVILCNGTFTVTLLTAVGIPDHRVSIKNVGTGVVTIDGNGSETIDGGTTAVLSIQYDQIGIVSDNSNWQIAA